jgi:hypothetical protein
LSNLTQQDKRLPFVFRFYDLMHTGHVVCGI